MGLTRSLFGEAPQAHLFSDTLQVPPQARHKEHSTVAPQPATNHTKRDEYEGRGNISDIESAISAR